MVDSPDEQATNAYIIHMIWTGAPGPPTISKVTPGGWYLNVSWTPPTEPGFDDITSYDLRYIKGSAADKSDSNWTVMKDVWTAQADGDLEHNIFGLSSGIGYDVQVRAVIGIGSGPWSATKTGTPHLPSVCVIWGAVKDPTNTGLVSDCEALLVAGDILAGSGSLNWSANVPMEEWKGVRIEGTPLHVHELLLEQSGLTGTIPPELGRLTSLKTLWLSHNDLTGPIPPELGNLSNLHVLNLLRNELTGPIPSELRALANLRELYLSHNRLSGPVPSWLGSLTNLKRLVLGNNTFVGPIPAELGRLQNLDILALSNNRLSGPIPTSLGDLSNLFGLWLDGNDLTGPIPPELGELTKMGQLDLSRNKLTGEIPPGLRDFSGLAWLILYDNELTGEIPPWLGNLNLEILRLNDNRFTGTIPVELGSPPILQVLDLSGNQLTGSIPEELSYLSNLDSLDLHGERIERATIPCRDRQASPGLQISLPKR